MAGIDANTSLCLHMDGTDGSTTFTDSSLTPKAVTAVGDAQIDTAQSVFGGAAGLFDGTGDCLRVADSAVFDYGTANVTIDARVRFAALPTSGNLMALVSHGNLGGSNYWTVDFFNNAGTLFLRVVDGAVGAFVQGNVQASIATATWYHIAYTRNSNAHKVYVNGVTVGTATNTSAFTAQSGSVHVAAIDNSGTPSRLLNGWIDELRIQTAGVWSTDFTPPTAAYSSGSSTTIKTINGVAYAGVKKVNGVAIASVKKYIGVA